MRKLTPALLMLPALALSGCAMMSGKRVAPDEFAVVRNAPLIIPPDYTLAPPVAGTAAISPSDARPGRSLFGGPAPRSSSDQPAQRAGPTAQRRARSRSAIPTRGCRKGRHRRDTGHAGDRRQDASAQVVQ